jgi:hypothetical protein
MSEGRIDVVVNGAGPASSVPVIVVEIGQQTVRT